MSERPTAPLGRNAARAIASRALVCGLMGAPVWACSDAEVVLPLPASADALAWVVVTARGSEVLEAHHVTADDVLRVPAPNDEDGTPISVEALSFLAPLDGPRGRIDATNDGPLLPAHDRAFHVEGGSSPYWAEGRPSAAALGVRLPRAADDCPTVETRTELLSTNDPTGVTAIVDRDATTRLVITPSAWFAVGVDHVTPVTSLVEGVRAVAKDPGGGDWLATSDALWSTPDRIGRSQTASRAIELPAGMVPYSIASPDPGVVYGLDLEARLFMATTATVVVIHRFRNSLNGGTRGMVIDDGNGVLAGVGSDSTFVRAEGRDVRRYPLGDGSEGAVSIARFAEYGIVVGTNSGRLLAERLDFAPVPDPLQQLPRGVQIRALEDIGPLLLFAGNSGLFGQISPRRFVCVSSAPAASGVRFLDVVGDQVIAGGLPFEGAIGEVRLTRFILSP